MSFLRKSLALLLSLLVLPLFAQKGRSQKGDGLGGGQEPNQPLTAHLRAAGPIDFAAIFREIDDPSSRARWLLIRSSDHPGAPGNLILMPSDRSPKEIFRQTSPASLPAPVIRAGDALILEEHTPVVDARLEATALGPARTGAVLRARLKLGGRVVRAIASGPGSAILTQESEPQP
jgi:hypothetical protein